MFDNWQMQGAEVALSSTHNALSSLQPRPIRYHKSLRTNTLSSHGAVVRNLIFVLVLTHLVS